MIYKVDYSIMDVEKYKAAPPTLPMYVVAESFDSALKTAKKFETENALVREIKLATDGGNIAIARGFKGI